MKSREIREDFQRFFEERSHQRVPSAPVVPKDDPTLYFTNAGMNQFKDVFLGLGRREYTRAVDTQKCIRVSGKHNDLEEVGPSPRHHTFFEMLGNWSFGDYFKRDSVVWAWELLTKRWGIDKRRLWATVFEGDAAAGLEPDSEAEDLWRQTTDLLDGRVVRLSAKDNFWEMGATGPCGPCSEIHYYVGDTPDAQTREGFLAGGDDYVEIWNLVFIQYNRDEEGKLHLLPAKHVDTGMGFERISSVLQGVKNNYDTDVFKPLIGRIAELSARASEGEDRIAMRVIADHVRALTLAIADGALPANEGRGYVLRRLLRRAARYGRQLELHQPFLHQLTGAVVEQLGGVFPEVAAKQAHIALVLRAEEESFGKTLDRGLEIFERFSQKGALSGEDTFQLYDTYGFPLDLTQLMARERGLSVDTAGFEAALEQQRQRARQATRGQFKAREGVEDALPGPHSRFVGYTELETEAQVVRAESDEDGQVRLFLDQTPFYAQSGGQVGDRGVIEGEGFAVEVEDTVKARGGYLHLGRLLAGQAGDLQGKVRAQVDAAARLDAARNHTSTHLLHEALRRVLGEHVAQMGSLVTAQRLRFDFSHFAALEPEQLRQVAGIVNEQIRADVEVSTFEEDLEQAKRMGAQALFGEKYERRVRVVRIGGFSLELCGGTHVCSTGQIGAFEFLAEGGIAAGTRRAEGLTGVGAEAASWQQRQVLEHLGRLLNTPASQLPEKVEAVLARQRELERSLTEARGRLAAAEVVELVAGAQELEGIKVVVRRVENGQADTLQALGDGLRIRLGSGVGVLGAAAEGKVSFLVVVTDDLIKGRGLKAGDLVRQVAQLAGGSGGGRPHMAQAGAKDPALLDQALAAVPQILRRQLQG
ncbi:MAG: alanine--tRNA ligase [Candidatus Handelsmanbacteria bacterium]|nr:alanine--tRNA ligase [Candidatus Handelsmanbacteria bacterium]